MSELVGVSEKLVADALHELREKDLLDVEPQPMQSTVPGISRREAIGRGVRYAAAAVPMIVSATAATPAMASSGEITNCKTENRCVNADAVCCCCENGEAVTQSTGFTCGTPCSGRGGVFKETTGKMAV
ncbi:MAG TPA: hypothetical protein VK680_07425 [Solirubrobacteraceae bacterium]|nr:hypothetical protein [Solirubrobacteraceae bacterium]